MGTDIRHPVPNRVKTQFLIFDIWALLMLGPGSVAFYNNLPGNEVGLFYNAPKPTLGHTISIDQQQMAQRLQKKMINSMQRINNVIVTKQESPADAVKPARRKSMQKLLQFDVFRFISPNSISPNFKV